MKKLLLVILALVLVFAPACTCKNGVTGWDCFMQNLGAAVEKVCNFSVADSEEAMAGKEFIVAAAGMVGLAVSTVTVNGVSIEITQEKAEQLFDQVVYAAQTGGCMILTELQTVLAYFDQVKTEFTKSKVKTKAVVKIPDLTGLKAKTGK